MHAVELDVPLPRPTQRRMGRHFDPWLTWRIGAQCAAGGALGVGLGWWLVRWLAPLGFGLLIFGVLTGAFGVWCALGGLFIANEELRGHKFLVEQGVVAVARVVRLEHDDHHPFPVFEFRDEQDTLRRGRCSVTRGESWFWKIEVGDEFDVLCSPHNSRQFVPYAVALYEVTKEARPADVG